MTLCQPVKQSLISRASLFKPQHSGFTLVLKIFKDSEFRTAWGNEFHNFGAEHENEPLYRAVREKGTYNAPVSLDRRFRECV